MQEENGRFTAGEPGTPGERPKGPGGVGVALFAVALASALGIFAYYRTVVQPQETGLEQAQQPAPASPAVTAPAQTAPEEFEAALAADLAKAAGELAPADENRPVQDGDTIDIGGKTYRIEAVDPQEYNDAVDGQRTAAEAEYIDCNPGQRIPAVGPGGAKVAPCGGAWYGPDPKLKPRDAWVHRPKPDKPGVRHDELRYRYVKPSEKNEFREGSFVAPGLGKVTVGPRKRQVLKPGTYRLPYGSVTILAPKSKRR